MGYGYGKRNNEKSGNKPLFKNEFYDDSNEKRGYRDSNSGVSFVSSSLSTGYRRKRLSDVTPGKIFPESAGTSPDFSSRDTNCSLWLHKYDYLENSAGQSKMSDDSLQCINFPVPEEYAKFYDIWKKSLLEDQGAFLFEGKVLGRMVVGMGGESVLENSITLHRTYGVPYIPGSALKGLTAHYARNRLENMEKNSEIYEIVFGNDDAAGSVTFFDALYIPGTSKNIGTNNGKDMPLKKDIITPHHQDYNSEKQTKKGDIIPPAEYDDPVPIQFISSVGTYLIAIAGPDKLVQFVSEIMKKALKDEGIGAKTSSGYGRIEMINTQ